MEKNCRFGSSLAIAAILSMSVHIMFRVLSLVMSPFNRFVRLLPPSLRRVPWPLPCGSPAVPHLHQYYGVVRLLRHPSVHSPVDPRVHVPPGSERRSSRCGRRWGSSLRFLGRPCGACPGLAIPVSRHDLAITVAARYCLAARKRTLASRRQTISGLILTAYFLAAYASHPSVAR